jgi:hypothetical protein
MEAAMAEPQETDVKNAVAKMLEAAKAQGLTILEGPANLPSGDIGKVTREVDATQLPKEIQEAADAALQGMDEQYVARRTEQIKATKLAEGSDIGSLSPQKQAEVIKGMLSMVADDKAAREQVLKVAATLGIIVDDANPVQAPPQAVEAAPAPSPTPPAAPAPKAEPDKVVTSEKAMTHCPNCTWPLSEPPVEVTNDDKTRWLRSILGGLPFVKEYPLMGGRFILTFRTRTVTTNSQIYDQLAREIREGKIVSSELVTGISLYNFRARKLQFAASLMSASGLALNLPEVQSEEEMLKLPLRPEVKTAVKKRFAAGDNAIAIYNEAIFAHWGEHVYMMAFKEFELFERLCLRLVEASNSPDFWQGTDVAA